MATTSANLGLTLIPATALATTKYVDYISKTDGDGVDSNMQKIDAAVGALRTDESSTAAALNAHTVSTDMHVTALEKKSWNEKETPSGAQAKANAARDAAVAASIPLNQLGIAGGVASLDATGCIPVSQIPNEVKEIRIVTNLAARDAIVEKFSCLLVYVKDATADATVTSGGAYYLWDGTIWEKTGESESMDVVLQWANLQGKPGVFPPSVHTHTPEQAGAIPSTDKGAVSGVASLDASGKVPTAQLPAMNYDPSGSAAGVKKDLDTHSADDAKHVTSAEKTSWTGKAAGNHKHSAEDINNGTLSATHGGTGAAFLPAGSILIGGGAGPISSILPSELPQSASTAYGICSTAAGTAAKTVSVSGFSLSTGAVAFVLFQNGVPKNATLNVNSTGEKPIRWMTNSIEDNGIRSGDSCELVYTGSTWDLLSIDRLAAEGGVSAVSFAADSWTTIQKVCVKGVHRKYYAKGDTKTIALSTGESITVRIEDFDHDDLESGGKAPLSLMMVDGLNATRRMNASNTNVGGWGSAELRAWMSGTLFGQLPSDLQVVIQPVKKLTSAGNNTATIVTTSDKLWLPSYTEMNFPHNASYSPGGEGSPYPLFINDASRIKKYNGSAFGWWLRSPFATDATYFGFVGSNGSCGGNFASNAYAVVAGFCI